LWRVGRVYRIQFTKPIDQELVVDLDFSALSHKSERDLELLYLWCKEGWVKSALGDYHTQKQALSRYFLAAVVLADPVLDVIRRELRRLSPDVRIDTDQIKAVLEAEVLKREVLEGDRAEHAKRKISRAASTPLRNLPAGKEDTPTPETPAGGGPVQA